MSFVKNFLIVSKNGMFTIEVPSRREYHFLEDLKKNVISKLNYYYFISLPPKKVLELKL